MSSIQNGKRIIFDSNLIDTFYPDRSQDMEVCLYDFVKHYEKKVADNGEVKHRKRNKPILPNHKIFDPNKENQREDYYYSLLLLLVPFKEEGNLLQAGETAEKAFSHVTGPNSAVNVHHERLQQILQAQSLVKKIGPTRQDNKEEEARPSDMPEGLDIVGEARNVIEDIGELQQSCIK